MRDCDNCVHYIDEVCEHCYETNVTTCDGFRPVTPQGKWITGGKDVTGQYFYNEFICNKCFTVVTDKSNFCPNCGAKMQKEGVNNG